MKTKPISWWALLAAGLFSTNALYSLFFADAERTTFLQEFQTGLLFLIFSAIKSTHEKKEVVDAAAGSLRSN
ncbi:hypothetical protein DRW07_04360 [Alteromonas sediminis]|uniref:Uncharacterized protein n=1 Tax=Alteromonas sediminis TaxID=2259342 RepID=A0A3N5Y4U2_9ALTE|nr:hypothetical protein [Alteromonas sediminis]RPJ68640.1 hypothetical protein DRW07_04360 [Alteromonas sediminis]